MCGTGLVIGLFWVGYGWPWLIRLAPIASVRTTCGWQPLLAVSKLRQLPLWPYYYDNYDVEAL